MNIRTQKHGMCAFLCALALSAGLHAGEPIVRQLENGLSVFIAPGSENPIVSLQFSFRHGYAYTPGAEFEGIAHFYEHMLFKANSLTKSQPEFMRALGKLGAVDWNGTTGGELVNYYLTIPAAEFENALRLYSAVFIDTIFDVTEIEREVSVVSNEIEGNRRIPDRVLWRAIMDGLFPESYRTGHYETWQLRSFTRHHLVREKERFYVPDNCLLSVAGAVREADALTLIERYFGRWQRGQDRAEMPPLARRASGAHKPDTQILPGYTNPGMASLALAWHGPTAQLNRRETLAADVLAELISEKSGAYLPELVRRTALFSIDTSAFSFYTGRYSSEFIFQGDIACTNTDTLMADAAAIRDQLSAILADIANGKHTITAADIRRIAVKNRNGLIFRHEKPPAYLRDLGWAWGTADIEYFLDYIPGLASVSPGEIQNLAARWLRQTNLAILWVHDSVAAALSRLADRGGAE